MKATLQYEPIVKKGEIYRHCHPEINESGWVDKENKCRLCMFQI